jgi:hypothetical protein
MKWRREAKRVDDRPFAERLDAPESHVTRRPPIKRLDQVSELP